MVLFSHSSYASNLGGKQTRKKNMKLKKDLYHKDGKFVLSDGHPKEFAGQSCQVVARKGEEISDAEAKQYGLKETKAKEPKENKAK
tara:strand:+ start:2201 stop:2458 length:258 start_codon:yes stop_codon:yes gene_type:complete